jgi:hypothetical protein
MLWAYGLPRLLLSAHSLQDRHLRQPNFVCVDGKHIQTNINHIGFRSPPAMAMMGLSCGPLEKATVSHDENPDSHSVVVGRQRTRTFFPHEQVYKVLERTPK